MKKLIFLLVIVCFCISCFMDEIITGQETHVSFSTTLAGSQTKDVNAAFSRLRIIAFDETNHVARLFSYSEEDLDGTDLSINLPIGNYDIAFIANGTDENEVSAKIGDPKEKILLKLLKTGENYRESSEFLSVIQRVNITENSPPAPIAVHLQRRVGKVIVDLNDIDPDIDSIKVELKGVPYTSTVDGSKLGTANTILKKLAHVKGMRTCTAELLTFPVAANKAEIGILYTKNQVTYRGVMPMAPAIRANQIVRISGRFIPTTRQTFNFIIQDWDENVIDAGSQFTFDDNNPIVADDRPITGNPTGPNLLTNGDFETWETAPVTPIGWLVTGGAHNVVHKNTDATFSLSGNSARLEHQTYIYQDIPVMEGECFLIKLNVNSTAASYAWKITSTWRKASTALSGFNEKLQTQETKATDGWIEPLGANNKFRAPMGAKFLRIEIRTYSPGSKIPDPAEAVYVDNFEVRKLE
ncbi:FimB/Mfa2 family fimbrial subunit [Gabonibacter massiliensis]|uniref:FimB/Mfa2 family fimbrial subunit n=1 Tax=Gabonibacter massiliensis TaxID=1720195 RepID=UPI0009EB8833|nr:FimB/Mfa2 family fimbrial subunit [Gabonibacter massiliensis]